MTSRTGTWNVSVVAGLVLTALAAAVPSARAGQQQEQAARPAATEEAARPAPPPIRRWVDVEQVQLSFRYRYIEATNETVTSSAVQWQPQFRVRFPMDAGGRVAIRAAAGSGRSFTSGWDNTGAGLGEFSGAFNVKQLFVTVRPVAGLEVAAGGLGILRGQSSEITTYDNDGYLMGERVTWTPPAGVLDELSVTTAHLGDLSETNVFRRFDGLDTWNYQQVLAGWRLADGIAASTDYTRDGDTHILREAVRVSWPAGFLAGIRVEMYERLTPDASQGIHVSADLRPAPRLAVTAGVSQVDEDYGTLNADRWGRGLHLYCLGSVALTPSVRLGWFAGEAVGQDYVLPNEHRAEVLLTFNPTAALRDRQIF